MPKAGEFKAALQALKNKLPQGMFSTLDELIQAAPQQRMTAKQWKEYLAPGRTLEREGVIFPLKKEEIDYSLGDFFNNLDHRGENAMIDKDNIQALAQRQRPGVISSSGDHVDNFSQYSTQGSKRLGYFENLTSSPDVGTFPTHYRDDTISWHRGSRHSMSPSHDPLTFQDSPVLRLIDEIQSDRHSAAAEKVQDFESRPADPMQQAPVETKRRGYRTPEQEARFNEVNTGSHRNAYRVDYPEGNPNTDIYEEFNRLRQIPPDAPFKSPADYGRLELKKGMLDAVNSGDRYLGVTPSEGPIDWFNFNYDNLDLSDPDLLKAGEFNPEIMGSKHVYDKIYPGELRKLANQYGAPMHQLDLPVTKRGSGQPLSIIESESNDLPDYLMMARDLEPLGFKLSIEDLLKDYERAMPDHRSLPTARRELNEVMRAMESGDGEEGSQYDHLERTLYSMHNDYQREAPSQGSSRKIPAMELTPEVVEKIKKAGIPLWAVTGGIVGLDALSGDHTEGPALKAGGEVSDEESKPSRPKSKSIEVINRIVDRLGTPQSSTQRRQFTAGLLSQLYGLDTNGDPSFLGFDSKRPGLAKFRPGLVDEVVALPNMFGHGPKGSQQAEKRTEMLGDRINDSMGLDAPQGFLENLSRAGGTMAAQLPIPGGEAKTAATEAAGMLAKVGQKARQYGTGAMEWFSPTIKPSVGNYASGAAFGGVLGTTPEWLEKLIEAHPDKAAAVYQYLHPGTGDLSKEDEDWLFMSPQDKGYAQGGGVLFGLSSGPKTDPNLIGQQYLPPGSGDSAPSIFDTSAAPDSYSASRYVGSPKTEAELANYGSGPEATYFETNHSPMNIDFSRNGTGVPTPTATSGSSAGNKVLGALAAAPAIYKGLGMADSLLGTGMQGAVKSGVLKDLSALGIGNGGTAPALSAEASLFPEEAAVSGGASAAGSGAAAGAGTTGIGSTLAAAAPFAFAALPVAKIIGGLTHKDDSVLGGQYDPTTGKVSANFNPDTYGPVGTIAKQYGITGDQVLSKLQPALDYYYQTGDLQGAQKLIAKPGSYGDSPAGIFDAGTNRALTNRAAQSAINSGMTSDQALDNLAYYLINSRGLGTGKGDILSAIDQARSKKGT